MANSPDAAWERDDRWVALVLRNIEIARDLGRGAIAGGEDPTDVLDRQFDFVRGFVAGTSGLIVPPDMIDPAELAEAVELGQQLAKRFGW